MRTGLPIVSYNLKLTVSPHRIALTYARKLICLFFTSLSSAFPSIGFFKVRASIQLNLKSCPLAVNLLIRPAPPSLILEHFIYVINAESSIKGFSSPLLPSTPSLLPLTSLIFHPSLLFLHLRNTFLSPSLPSTPPLVPSLPVSN